MYSGTLFGCLLCLCAADTHTKQTRREAANAEGDEAIAVDASAKQTFVVWRDRRDAQLPSHKTRVAVRIGAMAGDLSQVVPSPGTRVFAAGTDSEPTLSSSASPAAQPQGSHVFAPGMDSMPAQSAPGATPGATSNGPMVNVFVPGLDSAPADLRKNAPAGSSAHWLCKDMPAEHTGFEVHTDEGFLEHASCQALSSKCHNWKNSTKVQEVCPVSCFICDPVTSHVMMPEPPCYDAVMTGVRFRNGPEAKCMDLANYCNHSTLYLHVQAACRLTCGLCEAHVGHVAGGGCRDLDTNDHPQYMIAGSAASCSDLVDFCSNSDESYLIRHKCPRTCGACPEQIAAAARLESFRNSAGDSSEYHANVENSDCTRRRRWGFCSNRRRDV